MTKLNITYGGGIEDYKNGASLTGSNTSIESNSKEVPTILIDYGLHQGARNERELNIYNDPRALNSDFLIVTHSHMDHIGRVPFLVKQGFKGKIIMTETTKKLARVMWKNHIKLQRTQIESIENNNRKKAKKLKESLKIVRLAESVARNEATNEEKTQYYELTKGDGNIVKKARVFLDENNISVERPIKRREALSLLELIDNLESIEPSIQEENILLQIGEIDTDTHKKNVNALRVSKQSLSKQLKGKEDLIDFVKRNKDAILSGYFNFDNGLISGALEEPPKLLYDEGDIDFIYDSGMIETLEPGGEMDLDNRIIIDSLADSRISEIPKMIKDGFDGKIYVQRGLKNKIVKKWESKFRNSRRELSEGEINKLKGELKGAFAYCNLYDLEIVDNLSFLDAYKFLEDNFGTEITSLKELSKMHKQVDSFDYSVSDVNALFESNRFIEFENGSEIDLKSKLENESTQIIDNLDNINIQAIKEILTFIGLSKSNKIYIDNKIKEEFIFFLRNIADNHEKITKSNALKEKYIKDINSYIEALEKPKSNGEIKKPLLKNINIIRRFFSESGLTNFSEFDKLVDDYKKGGCTIEDLKSSGEQCIGDLQKMKENESEVSITNAKIDALFERKKIDFVDLELKKPSRLLINKVGQFSLTYIIDFLNLEENNIIFVNSTIKDKLKEHFIKDLEEKYLKIEQNRKIDLAEKTIEHFIAKILGKPNGVNKKFKLISYEKLLSKYNKYKELLVEYNINNYNDINNLEKTVRNNLKSRLLTAFKFVQNYDEKSINLESNKPEIEDKIVEVDIRSIEREIEELSFENMSGTLLNINDILKFYDTHKDLVKRYSREHYDYIIKLLENNNIDIESEELSEAPTKIDVTDFTKKVFYYGSIDDLDLNTLKENVILLEEEEDIPNFLNQLLTTNKNFIFIKESLKYKIPDFLKKLNYFDKIRKEFSTDIYSYFDNIELLEKFETIQNTYGLELDLDLSELINLKQELKGNVQKMITFLNIKDIEVNDDLFNSLKSFGVNLSLGNLSLYSLTNKNLNQLKASISYVNGDFDLSSIDEGDLYISDIEDIKIYNILHILHSGKQKVYVSNKLKNQIETNLLEYHKLVSDIINVYNKLKSFKNVNQDLYTLVSNLSDSLKFLEKGFQEGLKSDLVFNYFTKTALSKAEKNIEYVDDTFVYEGDNDNKTIFIKSLDDERIYDIPNFLSKKGNRAIVLVSLKDELIQKLRFYQDYNIRIKKSNEALSSKVFKSLRIYDFFDTIKKYGIKNRGEINSLLTNLPENSFNRKILNEALDESKENIEYVDSNFVYEGDNDNKTIFIESLNDERIYDIPNFLSTKGNRAIVLASLKDKLIKKLRNYYSENKAIRDNNSKIKQECNDAFDALSFIYNHLLKNHNSAKSFLSSNNIISESDIYYDMPNYDLVDILNTLLELENIKKQKNKDEEKTDELLDKKNRLEEKLSLLKRIKIADFSIILSKLESANFFNEDFNLEELFSKGMHFGEKDPFDINNFKSNFVFSSIKNKDVIESGISSYVESANESVDSKSLLYSLFQELKFYRDYIIYFQNLPYGKSLQDFISHLNESQKRIVNLEQLKEKAVRKMEEKSLQSLRKAKKKKYIDNLAKSELEEIYSIFRDKDKGILCSYTKDHYLFIKEHLEKYNILNLNSISNFPNQKKLLGSIKFYNNQNEIDHSNPGNIIINENDYSSFEDFYLKLINKNKNETFFLSKELKSSFLASFNNYINYLTSYIKPGLKTKLNEFEIFTKNKEILDEIIDKYGNIYDYFEDLEKRKKEFDLEKMDAFLKSSRDYYEEQKLLLESYGINNIEDIEEAVQNYGKSINEEDLFSLDDIKKAKSLLEVMKFENIEEFLKSYKLSFLDAGHIEGSVQAVIELQFLVKQKVEDILDGSSKKTKFVTKTIRGLFSGDLGKISQANISGTPDIYPHKLDYAQIESTYAGRNHPIRELEINRMIKVINSTNGNILIPAFALERTQELICTLLEHAIKNKELLERKNFLKAKRRANLDEFNLLEKKGDQRTIGEEDRLGEILDESESIQRELNDIDEKTFDHHILLDSPLAEDVSEVFLEQAPEKFRLLDDSIQEEIFGKKKVTVLGKGDYRTIYKSAKKLRKAVILSSGGMLQGGAIINHLKYIISDPDSTIIFTGYQAKGTLGHDILHGKKNVIIDGEIYEVKCNHEYVKGFSSHIDQGDLLKYTGSLNFVDEGAHIALTHGGKAREGLSAKIDKEVNGVIENVNNIIISTPKLGDTVEISI